MDLQHPVALLAYGVLAGGFIIWLIDRLREKGRISSVLVESGAKIARLEESLHIRQKELHEKEEKIGILEKGTPVVVTGYKHFSLLVEPIDESAP